MKILDLHLTFHWYDMIVTGEKIEEYRKIKPFWIKRLFEDWITDGRCNTCTGDGFNECRKSINGAYGFKDYSHVCFHRGYTTYAMLLEIKDIAIGRGNPQWSAPDYDTFIIKLGKKIWKH